MIKILNTEIQKPLSFLMAMILMICIIFISSFVTQESSKFNALQELRTEMLLSNALSNLIHEIQKERGISSGYLASKGNILKQELKEQRDKTDKCIIQTKHILNNLNHTAAIRTKIDKIKQKRTQIDTLSIHADDSIDFYSQINKTFLKKIMLISKISNLPKLTKNILAYNNFLSAKEYAGIERALGLVILSSPQFFKKNKIKFIKNIATQEIYFNKFLAYASKVDSQYFKKTMTSEEAKIISNIQEAIFNADTHKNIHINPQIWLKNMNIKIDKINDVAHTFQHNINQNIEKTLKHTQYLYIAFLLIDAIFIIIFLLLIYHLFKLYKDEKIKRLIMEKYIISSSTDLKGKITYVSQAFCKISGYTQEELLGKPHSIVRHPDIPKETFKNLWETIQSGKVWTSRVKNRKKNGDSYWVYATVEPIFNSKGDAIGYASVRVDITSNVALESKISEEVDKNHKQAEIMFQQSKLAQMGELISMIAHQWRQPLTAISATGSSIQIKAQTGQLDVQTATELSQKITDYSKHLSTTINDFRNFFKENKDKNNTTLDSMVKDVLNIIHLSLENENISLKLNLNSDIKINTYSNEVKQVIMNIMKNAEDVLKEKNIQEPQITITTQGTTLRISDNAGGIPQEIIEKIFDPYFSTKKQKDGTGLGLYMSKTIINEHCEGELNVYNDKDGAIFEIVLGEKCD